MVVQWRMVLAGLFTSDRLAYVDMDDPRVLLIVTTLVERFTRMSIVEKTRK